MILLQTIGASLAAKGTPIAEKIEKMAREANGGPGGPTTVWGTDDKMAAVNAALVLGTISDALDWEDVYKRQVDIVSQGGAFGTELAVVIGVLRRAFHPDDLPVLYIAVHATVVTGAADRAQGMSDLDSGVLARNLCLNSFLKFSQRIFLLKIR